MPDPRRETPEELLRIDRRRRRRWRRAWGAIGLVLLLLVAGRMWWGHMAHRRLAAVIDRYRATGEPILVTDFLPKRLPRDEENAALVYADAYAAVVVPPNIKVRGEYFVDDCRLAFAYPEDSRLWVESNGDLTGLLRRAEALSECDWGMRFTSPLYVLGIPSIAWVRNFQRTLSTLAVAQHVIGDDAASVETLLHVQRVNKRILAPRESFIIEYYIAAACESLVCHHIEAIAPKLKVSGLQGDEAALPQRSVSRASVQTLIVGLLDDEAWNTGWRNSINGERALVLDCVETLRTGAFVGAGVIGGSGPVAARAFDALIGPTFRLDAARGLESMTRLREAGLMDTYPAAKRATFTAAGTRNIFDDSTTVLDQASHVLALQGSRSSDRWLMPHFRSRANRRMAATALAIRLYELDHGRRPATLSELVPRYLSSVPQDPFAEPAQPLMYLPDNRPPIVYSVHEDGIDERGEEAAIEWAAQRGDDRLFYLDGNRPDDPIDLGNVLVNPPKDATEDRADE